MKSVILLVVLFVGVQSVDDLKTAQVNVKVVPSIKAFLKAHPTVNVTELKLDQNLRLSQNLYTLGARRADDRLVAADNGWAQYPFKQDLELTVRYPASGTGAIVTYMQVLISQDTGTAGKGYVVSGGVGQRYLQIVVEAWSTAYIEYNYSIYGI